MERTKLKIDSVKWYLSDELIFYWKFALSNGIQLIQFELFAMLRFLNNVIDKHRLIYKKQTLHNKHETKKKPNISSENVISEKTRY